MNKLYISVPSFVQTDHPPSAIEFSDVEHLRQIAKERRLVGKGEHLELSGDTLLAVSEDKLFWMVIGRVASKEKLPLPTWRSWYKVKREDGRIEVTDEVMMCSGSKGILCSGEEVKLLS